MNFYHSGEIGDILYSLKAIQRVGGHLYVNRDLLVNVDLKRQKLVWPNKPFDVNHFNFLSPLINKQSYIKSFQMQTPESIDYNLNDFRKTIFEYEDINFADLFVKSCNFNVDKNDGHKPWIYCDSNYKKRISVIRVKRRNNPNFPWKTIARTYHSEMLFLGTKQEHEDFTNFVKYDVEHFDNSNLLEISEVINGSSVFIGNCTSLTVCAEALKKNMIYESEATRSQYRYYLHEFNRFNRHNVDPDDNNVRLTMEKIEQFLNAG